MTEKAVAAPSGLITGEAVSVPLTGVSIDAEISAFCARVSITQRYVNREPKPIEALYTFPLDEGAAVCGFEAIIDGTLVVGEVKEREHAFRMYDDAMEQGHGAFLLDEERPDVFRASVGNLPPGKEALLRLTYVTELSVDGRSLRFSIPTTVSPRYAPAEDRIGVGCPDSETLNPPVAWRVPYGLNLSVRLSMPGRIERIESPSHPIAVSTEGSGATVTLSQREAPLDRDFVLSIDVAGIDRPQAWVERDEQGAESVAVAFVPSLGTVASPCEVIFLVDRSGSMGGTSIAEVRNALQLCLRSMIPGCAFNIVGFGSGHEMLFSESRPYDQSSLTEASAHVESMDANLGGTNILPALEAVLTSGRHATLTRQVVILTDGEVTNTDAVLACVRAHAATARVFTFGIGAGSSQHLVRGLARAGGGVAEFIFPGERIEPKVVRQFERLLMPALTNVRVNWAGLNVTQAPSAVPPVHSGGRVILYGLARGTGLGTKACTVTLTADAVGGSMTCDVPIDSAKAGSGRAVATLAARARIRELEEDPAWAAGRGSRQRERKASASTQEIVELAIKYSLISRETSFVAIERRDTPVQGDVQLRRVPIALTNGWGGVEQAPAAPRFARLLSAPGASLAGRAAAMFTAPDGSDFDSARLADSPMLLSRAQRPARFAPPAPAASRPPTMIAIVSLQRADGSWDLTEELAKLIDRKWSAIEGGVAGASGDRDEVRQAWATALALAWLHTQARHAEDEWRMLAVKGRQWLAGVAAMPPGGGAWFDAAARFLRS